MSFSGAAGLWDMATPASTEIQLALRGPLRRADVAGLWERACRQIRPGVAIIRLDVSAARADAVTVDALAQLQLHAGRRGCQVRLRACSRDLRELIAFMGLTEVLPED